MDQKSKLQIFSTKEINNLITGNIYVFEFNISSTKCRRFLSIGAYQLIDGRLKKPDKFLEFNKKDMYYFMHIFEVSNKYFDDIESNANDYDLYKKTVMNIDNIESINDLEERLSGYVEDFSFFELKHNTDIP